MPDQPKLFNNLSFVTHAWRRKPRLFFRALYFFICKLINKPVVRGMDIAITYHCNLKCEHCNIASQSDENRPEMDAIDIINAIQQLRAIGGFYITFTGGEPLLAIDKIKKVVGAVGKRSMLYQIQTNGTLLDEKICRDLKDIGIDNIQISFDVYHELTDWQDVVQKKAQQLQMLRKCGLDVFFTWLASHKTLASGQLDDIIMFSNKYKIKIGLNFAVPQGRWADAHDHLLTKEDSLKVRDISRKNKYLYIDLQNNLFFYGCPAFSERLHINAYGDVQPCTFFQISFGNIKEEPMKTIWDRGRNSELFSGFPDHCPPAENRYYINKILKCSEAYSLPVHYKDFFHTATSSKKAK